MNINQMFNSPYLSAADIEGDSLVLTIDSMRQEEIGQQKDLKWVLYFKEATKGLVLNVTNTKTLGQLYGNETDHWMHKPVSLIVVPVNMNGETKDGIRISPRAPRGNQPPAQSVQGNYGQTYNQRQQQPTQNQRPTPGNDDTIPF